MKTYARLTSLGFELVVLVLMGLAAANWLKTKLNLKGLEVAICLFIVMGFWIYRVISTLNSIEKEQSKDA